MIPSLIGLVFLLVGGGVYHFNTHSHGEQIVFPNMTPDQTVAALLGLGVLMLAVGAGRWLFQNRGEEV